MAKHSMDDGASAYRGRGVQAERIQLDRCELSRLDQERERMRRVLIYADMIQTLGRVEYTLLTTWPYQPTDEEVTAALPEGLTAASRMQRAADKRRKTA